MFYQTRVIYYERHKVIKQAEIFLWMRITVFQNLVESADV